MELNPSDERLLQAFADGERRALGELARRHERALLGMAAGLLGGSRELARDAVQETWVRVIRFAGSFDGRSTLKTWLYRILINRCHDLRLMSTTLRGVGRSSDADSSAPHGAAKFGTPKDARPELDRAPVQQDWPDQAAMASEQRGMVRDAVQRLAPDRRDTVLLCYHAGMTHEEAATILEIPIGTLKSRLHASLQELRSILAEPIHD